LWGRWGLCGRWRHRRRLFPHASPAPLDRGRFPRRSRCGRLFPLTLHARRRLRRRGHGRRLFAPSLKAGRRLLLLRRRGHGRREFSPAKTGRSFVRRPLRSPALDHVRLRHRSLGRRDTAALQTRRQTGCRRRRCRPAPFDRLDGRSRPLRLGSPFDRRLRGRTRRASPLDRRFRRRRGRRTGDGRRRHGLLRRRHRAAAHGSDGFGAPRRGFSGSRCLRGQGHPTRLRGHRTYFGRGLRPSAPLDRDPRGIGRRDGRAPVFVDHRQLGLERGWSRRRRRPRNDHAGDGGRRRLRRGGRILSRRDAKRRAGRSDRDRPGEHRRGDDLPDDR